MSLYLRKLYNYHVRLNNKGGTLFVRLIFICTVLAMGQQRISYLLQSEERSIRHHWDMGSNEIAMTRGKEYQHIAYSSDGNTKRFTYCDTLENIYYVAERNGATITIIGSDDGKPVSKEFKIDSDPWYQSAHDFSDFAMNKQREELYYWVLRPSDMRIVKMRARKGESDNPLTHSTIVAAPVGVYAKFWRAHYSYRNSDGLFVKFRAKQRIPGGTTTVISLLNDQYVSK